MITVNLESVTVLIIGLEGCDEGGGLYSPGRGNIIVEEESDPGKAEVSPNKFFMEYHFSKTSVQYFYN